VCESAPRARGPLPPARCHCVSTCPAVSGWPCGGTRLPRGRRRRPGLGPGLRPPRRPGERRRGRVGMPIAAGPARGDTSTGTGEAARSCSSQQERDPGWSRWGVDAEAGPRSRSRVALLAARNGLAARRPSALLRRTR
jgi:hypothetical protein